MTFGDDTLNGEGTPLLLVKKAGNSAQLYPTTGTPTDL